jgi:hypothetical protein
MKFLVTKDKEAAPLLRVLMGGLLIAILLYLPMSIALHGVQLGFTPQMLQATLYGDEAAFVEPILLDVLLLQVHIDLFMTLFVVMMLSALAVRLLDRKTSKLRVLHLLGVTGLLMPLSLLGAYFFGTFLLYVWIGVFLVWHLFAFGLSVILIQRLLR